jgi:hypothetical protein
MYVDLNGKCRVFSAHLESSHVPRIAGVLEAVLIALEKELEEKPGKERRTSGTRSLCSERGVICSF